MKANLKISPSLVEKQILDNRNNEKDKNESCWDTQQKERV